MLKRKEKERLGKKDLEQILELSRVKGSVYQLPKKLQDVILPQSTKSEVLNQIEELFGKKERNRVESWIKNYKYDLPNLLGERFSYNLVATLFAVFIRYLINRILSDEKTEEKFKNLLNYFFIDKDISKENKIRGWLRRDITFSQRFFSFSEEFRKSKGLNNEFLAYFYYKILQTPIAERSRETKLQLEFAKNVLSYLRLKETPSMEKEMDKLISDFILWLIENTPVIPYPDKRNPESLKIVRRKESIFSALLVRYNWVTRKVADLFAIDEGQSDEELFPHLHQHIEKNFPEIIKKSEDRAKKDVENKQKKK